MKTITVESLAELLRRHGLKNFMLDLMQALKRDFGRWNSFTKMPRPAMHVPGGVLELMPVCDNERYYSFKYVNCHPKNPLIGLQTVVAIGQLSRIDTGYPIMLSEMTILTALRTAATTALATDLMARKNSEAMAIIGTGAQSEFLVKAIRLVRSIKEVRYFDTDPTAMDKFEKNTDGKGFKLKRCADAQEATTGSDIITTCTASKTNAEIIKNDWINPGMHINALGGDTVGKTELELSILPRCRIAVEHFDQTFIEGEIQRLNREQAKALCSELHELVDGSRKGREQETDITLFDSVGIALEDYSALRLTYELSQEYGIGEEINLVPLLKNPKDLIAALKHASSNDKL